MTIGIPRSLSFYSYGPLWQIFLEALGMETVLSGPTCKSILDLGVKACVDDACLPVKIFHGHVLSLEKQSDAILIPMEMSEQKKEYSCPLICGLPEMARHSLKIKTPLLPFCMNLHKIADNLYSDMESFGLLFTHDKRRIKKAYYSALMAYGAYTGAHAQSAFLSFSAPASYPHTLGILGHPYILYDDFLSGVILRTFAQAGFRMVFPEMVRTEDIEKNADALPKKMFWSAGKHLYGSARHMMQQSPDGMVYISSFGCGVDSIIADLVERMVRKQSGVPFLLLTLDEHTGEAGLKTRAEAFCDMIQRRQSHGRDLPAYG